jgi:uncharacterized protein YlaI
MMAGKNTICVICNKAVLTKNEIGLCKKLLGEQVQNYFCIGCLADYLDTTVEDLSAKIEDFKEQGCVLFS